MSDQPKTKPTARVAFARSVGTDENGREKLGPLREIGAIWPRRDASKGGVLRLDHIPVELTQREGVIFILPVLTTYQDGEAA